MNLIITTESSHRMNSCALWKIIRASLNVQVAEIMSNTMFIYKLDNCHYLFAGLIKQSLSFPRLHNVVKSVMSTRALFELSLFNIRIINLCFLSVF